MCQPSNRHTATQATKVPMSLLPATFKPGKYDVICGLGKDAKSHEGNVRLRQLVDQLARKYGDTKSKTQKSKTVSSIIDFVRQYGGGFVKLSNENDDGRRWYDVGDAAAREKVGQSLRERNHDQYLSSSTTKRRMRREINERLSDKVELVMERNWTIKTEIRNLQRTIQTYNEQHGVGAEIVNDTQSKSIPVIASRACSMDEFALEAAMTKANMRILDSLKQDDELLHNAMLTNVMSDFSTTSHSAFK